MNNIVIIGRLTADPELQETKNGKPYAAVTVAIDRGKDHDGNDMGADFPRVYVYGKTAENMCKYMSKGRQIGIQGRIRTGSYEKDGQTHFTTDVLADRVEFLGSGNQQQSQQQPAQQDDNGAVDGFSAIADDDIPF